MDHSYQYYLAKALNNWQPLLSNSASKTSLPKLNWFQILSDLPLKSTVAIPLFHGLLSGQENSQHLIGRGWLRQLSIQKKCSFVSLEQIVKTQNSLEEKLYHLSLILQIPVVELEKIFIVWLKLCWKTNIDLLRHAEKLQIILKVYIRPGQLPKTLTCQLLQTYSQLKNVEILEYSEKNIDDSNYWLLVDEIYEQEINQHWQILNIEQEYHIEKLAAAEQRQFSQVKQVKSTLWEIGFNKLGSCFVLFTLELINLLQNKTTDELWFLGRDGYLLQQLYRLFSEKAEKLGYQLPKEKYIQVSRASTLAAAYPEPTPELLSKLFNANKNQGLTGIAVSLGFSSDCFKLSRFWPEYQSKPITQEIISKIFSEPLVLAAYQHNQRKAKNSLIAYLQQHVLNGSQSVTLVDIGWNGTVPSQLQDLLKQIGLPEIEVVFFGRNYHALSKKTENINFCSGLIYDQKRNNPIENCVNQFRELFEMAACSAENTVIGYIKSNNIWQAKFISGSNPQRINNSKEIQSGIMAHANIEFDDWLQHGWTIDALRPNAMIHVAELIMRPTISEQNILKKLEFEACWGNIHTQALAKVKTAATIPAFSPAHFNSTETLSLQGAVNQLTHLIASIQQMGPIVIYGAGSACNLLLPHLKQVEFIVDNNKSLHGSYIHGIKINSIEALERTTSTILVTVLNRQVEVQSILSAYHNHVCFLDEL